MDAKGLGPFVSFVSLSYHEARNVRHLIRGGFLDSAQYELIRSLPTNRAAAWAELQDLRKRASQSTSASAASEVFASRFQLTLEDLVDLFSNLSWRDAPYGGNQWREITQAVIALREALDSEDAASTRDLVESIPVMRHNTGRVGDKLRNLDASLADGGRS